MSFFNVYKIPEHIKKQLKTTTESDGSVVLLGDRQTLLEIRSTFIEYLCKNFQNINCVYQSFNQFRNIDLLNPLAIIHLIPTNAGFGPFFTVLRVLPLLLEAGYFQGQYQDYHNVDISLILCQEDELDILFDEIINFWFQFFGGPHDDLAISMVSDGIGNRLYYMKEQHVSKTKIEKFIDHIISCPRLSAGDINNIYKSLTDTYLRGMETLVRIGAQHNRFDYVLKYLDTAYLYFKSQNLTRVEYNRWLYRVEMMLRSVLHNSKSFHKQFIKDFAKRCIWNNQSELFFTIFKYTSMHSIVIVMQNYNVAKLIESPNPLEITEDYKNLRVKNTISREIELYKFACQTTENVIYNQIMSRIDDYFQTKLSKDVIILILSFEFMLLCFETQYLMYKRLKQMVDLRFHQITLKRQKKTLKFYLGDDDDSKS